MKEKWISHIIAAGAFVVFIVLGLASATVPQNKVFGDFTYKIVGSNEVKTVTITGYTGVGGAAEIPATIEGLPVTAIGKDAFDKDIRFNKSVKFTSLTIPASVIMIGNSVDEAEDAFDWATELMSITVDEANSVYSSADGVLFNKAKTKLLLCPEGKSGNYTIPSSVTDIVECAFELCTRLTSVTIPDSVTSIGKSAFVDCHSLASINIPNSVTYIGRMAFAECHSLASISIPNNVTYIGAAAFAFCTRLTTVTISPVNGRKWELEVDGQQIRIFADCPLNDASKTALLNAGYPRRQGQF